VIANADQALRLARLTMSMLECDPATAVASLPISVEVKDQVRAALEQERLIHIKDPYMILNRERVHQEWLPEVDRAEWIQWPRLRDYFLTRSQRPLPDAVVHSVDEVTNRVLGSTENPATTERFTTKGLVLGYVQSGKTTNYSALIAKAADVGFKLFIVLSGIHDGLRVQTQKRLYGALVAPEAGGPLDASHKWVSFTANKLKGGDFDPGNVEVAALTGPNPKLMVVKKNATVLRRLLTWLDALPAETRRMLPVLIIDDEADLATPNTGGNRPAPDSEEAEGQDLGDEAEPSRINELIRLLVNKFSRVAYIAYTATPFATVFIDHNAIDLVAGKDLYPRDFIVDLPKPHGYFGAERIFGRADDDGADELDVIRYVPDDDVARLVPAKRDPGFVPELTASVGDAFLDFVLAGAAMAQRGKADDPASMLIHTSYLTNVQNQLTTMIAEDLMGSVKDDWRYNRKGSRIEERLQGRWESDCRRVTRSIDVAREVSFEAIRDHVGPFLEKIEVRQLNSGSEDELDYELEPQLKVVVIGGNRLSRGLTLENLLVSYYVRPAMQYDTLMQMGRWFGYREGYEDLTRIYTTTTLAGWFRDLATVELELREDIARYDREHLTPVDFGLRIRTHPALLPTSRLKMKATDTMQVSFQEKLVQTITFPFKDIGWLGRNLETARGFLSQLGPPQGASGRRLVWKGVPARAVRAFLDAYQMDPSATKVRSDLLRTYIQGLVPRGELTRWVVAVAERSDVDARLGTMDLDIAGGLVANAIDRTRIKGQPSLKAIVSAPDEAIGIDKARLAGDETTGAQFRALRPPAEGLLLIYPISRRSGHGVALRPTREPIYANPDDGCDVIGVALSFPHSDVGDFVEYIVGSVGAGLRT